MVLLYIFVVDKKYKFARCIIYLATQEAIDMQRSLGADQGTKYSTD